MMSRFITGVLLVLVALAGAALGWRHQATEALRAEVALLREENRELVGLRAEQRRLVTTEMSAEELTRLRGDHVAVIRLRGEIEKSKEALRVRERALAERSADATSLRGTAGK